MYPSPSLLALSFAPLVLLLLRLALRAARRRNKNHPSPTTTTTHACALPPGAAYEPDMNRGHSSSSKLINEKLEEHRISTAKHCPHCGEKIDSKPDWVGLPAGVKFDPTDQELIEHLEAKVKDEGSRSHPLIDEFIPTIDGEDGICYTHPEKLPGVTRDGLSKHFFHRPSKAYTTGTRKRRKIQTECDVHKGETRWHKTGKTRPVMVNGRQKGCKKILVLYTNFGKHRKPEKTNWVMHQYHLGDLEEEKEGELVVCKIFYQTQPRQCSWSSDRGAAATSMAATTTAAAQEQHRRDSGSGSCSSRDHEVSATSFPAGYAVTTAVEMQQHMKQPADHFSFSPFRKTFDQEVGIGGDQVPSNQLGRSEPHHAGPGQQPHGPVLATTAVPATAFLISRPSNPVSTIVPPAMQHASVVLDHDQFHVPAILLHHNDKFQPQHQQQQPQQKLDRRSAGLEELIMGCTSSTSTKGETLIAHPQETEWPYPYWPPDNQDHHG